MEENALITFYPRPCVISRLESEYMNMNVSISFLSTVLCVLTDHVLNILGEWYDETAAGAEITQKMGNQRFVLRIHEGSVEDDGKLTVVLQLMQNSRRNVSYLLYIRLDILQVRGSI